MSYAANKLWRIRHPQARNKGKRRYYAKHREDPLNKKNAGQEWTIKEMDLITDANKPVDRVLAHVIGRSVQAIQVMRARLKKTIE